MTETIFTEGNNENKAIHLPLAHLLLRFLCYLL